jgi:hypothetical protein
MFPLSSQTPSPMTTPAPPFVRPQLPALEIFSKEKEPKPPKGGRGHGSENYTIDRWFISSDHQYCIAGIAALLWIMV